MEMVGDYWDEETVSQVVNLFKEYQDIFLSIFSKMKEIVGKLGDMRIQMCLDVKLIKKRSYKHNPKYKKKVIRNMIKWLKQPSLYLFKCQNG